ncbi:hypothetical protein [Methylocaldum gracile]
MRNVTRFSFFLLVLTLLSPWVRGEINITIECDATGVNSDGSPCTEPPPGENGGLTNGGTGDAPIGQKTPNLLACKDGECTQVPIGSGDHNTPTTPEGWDGPDSPPSVTSPAVQYYWGRFAGEHAGSTPQAAATQLCAGGSHSQTGGDGVTTYTFQCTSGMYSGFTNSVTRQSETVCPAGYTASGNDCVLSDAGAAQWPSDGKCDGKRDGNTWIDHPRDPDCPSNGGGSGSSVPAGFSKSAGNDQLTGADSSGKSVSAKQNADGSVTVTITAPNADGKTSSQKTIQLGPPGADGLAQVTGKSEGNIPGQGSLAGQGPQQGGTMDCPDCAKEGTLKAIKDELQKASGKSAWVKPNKDARDEIDKTEEIDQAKADLRALLDQIKAEASGLLTAGISGVSYSCTPSTVPGLNVTFDLCLTPYLDELSIIGLGLLFLAFLIALFWVLS